MNQIKRMRCCVCDASCLGRQWWNRDNNYGICSDCAKWVAKSTDSESMRSLYGDEGVHYFIQKDESAKTCNPLDQ